MLRSEVFVIFFNNHEAVLKRYTHKEKLLLLRKSRLYIIYKKHSHCPLVMSFSS